jgi:hemoglobin
MLAVCVAALALTTGLRAQPDKTGAAGLDPKELDQRVFKVLREVINTGADLYNRPNNDHNGCYRLYQGSLTTLKPMLDHRPGLQKTIDDALTRAAKDPSVSERAFILRAAIDQIREETGGQAKITKKGAKDTLWDRLGGEKNVRKVVDDFVGLAATDPKVDFFRGGKYKPTDKEVADLKQKLVEFVSAAAGGPLKYSGRDMKEVHKGMGITDAQFNALAADLKTALDKNGAKPTDRDAVLEAVGSTRKDIVEAKEEKKKQDLPKPKFKDLDEKDDKEPGKKEKDGAKKGGDQKAAANIKGHITLDGKPIEAGTITFVPAKDGKAKSIDGVIKEDGTYEVKKVPPGAYKIKLVPPAAAKASIPAKYQSEETSGLTLEVVAGAQTYEIELRK